MDSSSSSPAPTATRPMSPPLQALGQALKQISRQDPAARGARGRGAHL